MKSLEKFDPSIYQKELKVGKISAMDKKDSSGKIVKDLDEGTIKTANAFIKHTEKIKRTTEGNVVYGAFGDGSKKAETIDYMAEIKRLTNHFYGLSMDAKKAMAEDFKQKITELAAKNPNDQKTQITAESSKQYINEILNIG